MYGCNNTTTTLAIERERERDGFFFSFFSIHSYLNLYIMKSTDDLQQMLGEYMEKSKSCYYSNMLQNIYIYIYIHLTIIQQLL